MHDANTTSCALAKARDVWRSSTGQKSHSGGEQRGGLICKFLQEERSNQWHQRVQLPGSIDNENPANDLRVDVMLPTIDCLNTGN